MALRMAPWMLGGPVRTPGVCTEFRGRAFVLLALLIGVCDWTPARGQLAQTNPSAASELPKLNPDGWTSSAVCGECHQAIHAVWRESLHSNAWSNGVFQAGYRRTIDRYGAEKARLCLTCHAPTVRHTKDFEVKEPITAEGVTCDFCHSVSEVRLDEYTDRIRFRVGAAKYGPLRHAQSPVHEIVDSPLHTRSEFCAGCHEYKNAHGVTVLGTYGEWKASSHARRGRQCQDCHMPLVPGRVVALDVKRDTPASVNLHNISGSHDLERVRSAVTLKLESYEWIGDRVWVYLKVTNAGSGHGFPTGLPMHRAMLEVTLRSGHTEVGRREIPFEVVMVDDRGRRLEREHEVFLKAVRVRSDTRLKPDEARSIEVVFRDVKATRLTVGAALSYQYSAEAIVTDEQGQRIEPVDMKFLIASCQRTMKSPRR